jgi:hypothetical protein
MLALLHIQIFLGWNMSADFLPFIFPETWNVALYPYLVSRSSYHGEVRQTYLGGYLCPSQRRGDASFEISKIAFRDLEATFSSVGYPG